MQSAVNTSSRRLREFAQNRTRAGIAKADLLPLELCNPSCFTWQMLAAQATRQPNIQCINRASSYQYLGNGKNRVLGKQPCGKPNQQPAVGPTPKTTLHFPLWTASDSGKQAPCGSSVNMGATVQLVCSFPNVWNKGVIRGKHCKVISEQTFCEFKGTSSALNLALHLHCSSDEIKKPATFSDFVSSVQVQQRAMTIFQATWETTLPSADLKNILSTSHLYGQL